MSEYISALLDGELAPEDFSKEISAVLASKKATQTWRDYQMIGDAMRGSVTHLSGSFTDQLMQKIEQEPTVLAPNAMPCKLTTNLHRQGKVQRLPATWSIAASCAAVFVVGWALLNQQSQQANDNSMTNLVQVSPVQTMTEQPKVAAVMTTVEKNVVTQRVNSASELSAIPLEYLAAHQASAPSVSSYYIQSASFSE